MNEYNKKNVQNDYKKQLFIFAVFVKVILGEDIESVFVSAKRSNYTKEKLSLSKIISPNIEMPKSPFIYQMVKLNRSRHKDTHDKQRQDKNTFDENIKSILLSNVATSALIETLTQKIVNMLIVKKIHNL